MRSRALRVTLTLLAAGAIATAAYFCWTIQSRAAAAITSAAAFHDLRGAALHEAYELRYAQQAYVASGQNEAFWFDRVTRAEQSLQAGLVSLRSATDSRAALAALDEADAAIQDFGQIDRRARGYASGGQKLLASDVIFSDGLEAAGRIITALDNAGAAVTQASGGVGSDARRQQALAAGSAAAVAVLALLLLMPLAPPPAAVAQERQPEPAAVPDNTDGLDIGSLLDGEMRDSVPPAPGRIGAQAPAEMERLASVCGDLARLSDTSLLPGILERTAAALDASGLVLWIADPGGGELLPIAAHGYAPSVLARMGSLKTDAENATAAAFRTGLLQTVSADAFSNGAIAVPLMTPNGCRGVMSAEVRHDAETQPARLAAAAIVAAQLATLVGPPAARAQGAAEAAR